MGDICHTIYKEKPALKKSENIDLLCCTTVCLYLFIHDYFRKASIASESLFDLPLFHFTATEKSPSQKVELISHPEALFFDGIYPDRLST